MLIYRFSVTRPKDTVEVWLIRNKCSPFEFQFVNISKGHICPCKFKTFGDAVKDMGRLKSEGKIIHYERLPDFDFKPLSTVPLKFEEEIEKKMTDEEIEKEAREWANEMYPSDGQAQRYLLMGAKFGYNKANEWHYVKNGDLPKDEEYKWCVTPSGQPYVARYEGLFVSWTNRENKEVCCPFAWKEIVLPELPKENE